MRLLYFDDIEAHRNTHGNTRRRCRSFIFNGDFFHIVSSLVDQGDASHAEKSAHTAQGPNDMLRLGGCQRARRLGSLRSLMIFEYLDDFQDLVTRGQPFFRGDRD